ncbi:MAG: MiaB-like protein tRNA modifying protein [Candidatus Peregrinibacteria bacterium GW2011_GWC2_39_14]|nr:MAG: Fe-S oxidoreductase [Candidatus Peregrinibacteria bacterium GW2011_GWA2_38_36]KKR06693.1 MAG: MiaB-like protein tRNA modifying protein [Candidatus Peregrinibacteria bacterium GW2011_GWC2_39_14]
MKIAFKTLGCRANRAESDRLLERLMKAGFLCETENSTKNFDAEIVIVNTCSVTNDADKKSRQAIRAIKNANPKAKIYVFGCSVRADKKFYENMEEVEFAGEIDEINSKLKGQKSKPQLKAQNLNAEVALSRTRAVIKIQDGCNNSCSYCAIRLVRGREKSYPMKEILNQIKEKVALGFKEIVLTGINITSWRSGDGGNFDFADLIGVILNKINVPRLRISSMEPESVNEKFAKLLKDKKFCAHIHLPLQSGSDKILKIMRRKYDTKKFEKACRMIRKFAPDAGITTDVIVGFPGESEKDFKETVKLCKKIGFSKIHVFPYSKRKNTPASIMPNQIDERVKKSRAKTLRNLSEQLSKKFIKSQLGKTYDVLFEEKSVGWTPNYIKVHTSPDKSLVNSIKPIKLTEKLTKF